MPSFPSIVVAAANTVAIGDDANGCSAADTVIIEVDAAYATTASTATSETAGATTVGIFAKRDSLVDVKRTSHYEQIIMIPLLHVVFHRLQVSLSPYEML